MTQTKEERQAYQAKYRARHREKACGYASRYRFMTAYISGRNSISAALVGEIAELSVAAFLEARGLLLGFGPPASPHDILSTLGFVQVKVGELNRKTGTVYLKRRRADARIVSPIIAVVNPEDPRAIRWISNTGSPIPPELL